MPTFPQHTLKQSLGGQSSGTRVDPNAAGEAGRETQRLGQAVSSFSQELQQYQDKWSKAADVNEYTTARNARKVGIADIMSRAEADTNHQNSAQYASELEDVFKAETVFANKGVKDRHDSEAMFDRDMTAIKLREVFNSKMVNHQRIEIQKDSATSEESYIEAGDIMRVNIKADYKDRLKGYKDLGFISEDEYYSEIKDMEDWEFNRAMKAAGDNPQSVIKDSARFDLTPKQKTEVLSMARKTIVQHGQIRDLETVRNQATNESVFNELVFTDEETSVAEKTLLLNTMQQQGKVSDAYAVNTRRVLTSVDDLSAETASEDISRIIRMTSDINVRFEEGYNKTKDMDYLKAVQAINMEIINTKNLSRKDRISLQNRLTNSTQKKQAKATYEIGKYGADIYKKADKYFEDNLPGYLRNESLRQFFNATLGEDGNPRELTDTEATNLARDIRISVQTDSRDLVKRAFDETRAMDGVGAGAELRLEEVIDKKTGKGIGVFGINVYKDGKRIKVGKIVRKKR